MKYFFPIHLDGGNRGCEAIAKGTSLLLDEPKENLLGLCRNIPLDSRLGVCRYVTLVQSQELSLAARIYNKLVRILRLPLRPKSINPYMHFLKAMTKQDVLISTGGDMMCYGNNMVNTTNNYAHSIGAKSILWGCSMGPENLTPEKENTLRNFSFVYARESLTYDFFKSLGIKNVCLYPDPAFILKSEECKLPESFGNGGVIGINFSNYVLGGCSLDTPFGREVEKMLDFIVNETSYHVLLIPHVLWVTPSDPQDDRQTASMVMEKYSATGRFSVLDSDAYNYCQLRYIISNCDMFIGGRTHAVISAYSTCTPALALGYSIKSKGIAKDLGISELLVVDSKHIKYEGSLLESFRYMLNTKGEIRKHLEDIIPGYKKKTYGIREDLNTL